MDNKHSLVIAVSAALIVIVAVVALVGFLRVGKDLGSSLTYSSAIGRLETYNQFSDVIADLQAVRRSSFATSASVTYNVGILSSIVASTTNLTTPGAASGDLVQVFVGTSTAAKYAAYGYVSGSGTTTVVIYSVGSTTVDMGTPVINVRTFASSSAFLSNALLSATTTTP